MYKSVREARQDGWKVMVSHLRLNHRFQLLHKSLIPKNQINVKGGQTLIICSKNGKNVVNSYTFPFDVNYNKKVGAGECIKGVEWNSFSL